MKYKENYDFSQFLSDLNEWNISLSEKQVFQFMQYYELLMEWNSVMNLTAITNYDEVMKKHFVDSLSLVKAYDMDLSKEQIKLIDIGTGAGFPGIPLKIAFPYLRVTLLDSLHKRIKFLDEVIVKLCLNEIDTIHGRAEDYAKTDRLRERYDLAVSRAVANLSTLSEYCLPFVKIDGKFVCYKSENIIEELSNAEKAISILGGKISEQVVFTLPDSDIHRKLIVVDKVKKTPLSYPRKAGVPSREPIR